MVCFAYQGVCSRSKPGLLRACHGERMPRPAWAGRSRHLFVTLAAAPGLSANAFGPCLMARTQESTSCRECSYDVMRAMCVHLCRLRAFCCRCSFSTISSWYLFHPFYSNHQSCWMLQRLAKRSLSVTKPATAGYIRMTVCIVGLVNSCRFCL